MPRGRDGRRADVVDLSVVAVEAEQQRRDAVGPRLPAHADDDAVGGLLRLHLHDAVARAGEVREVAALRDHAVEADRLEAVEPAERLVAIARRGGELEPLRAPLEPRAALRERLVPRLDALPHEDVERDEACGDLRGQPVHAALGGMQPHLHRVEVEDAVALDDDLAVERRERRQELLERSQLREVAQQRPRVARPEPELARAVLEQAAEAVPLRLVLPLVALGQLADELGLHRRERDRRMQVGRPLDRLARADARPGHGLKLLRSSPRASRRRHRSRSRHPARARRAVDLGRGGRGPERRRLDPRASTRASSRFGSHPR